MNVYDREKIFLAKAKAKEKHGNKFEYLSNFVAYEKNITIKCPMHGIFTQRPDYHLKGVGCNQCLINSRRTTFQEFLNRSKIAHNNKYVYHTFNDINNFMSTSIVLIKCPIHGDFNQSAKIHMNGSGCPACKLDLFKQYYSKSKDKVIEEFNEVHKGFYNYDKVVYKNTHTKVIIHCYNHGDWKQTPTHHLGGHGCPKCSTSISKQEISWLNSLNIPEENRQVKIKINDQTIIVDGFNPKTNTIYEFNGDFWHGNPSVHKASDYNDVVKQTYGALYDKTMKRAALIKKMGII